MKSIGIIGLLTIGLGSATALAQLAADTDGDGAVSLAELQAFRARVTEERFAALDTDGDGLLTSAEMRARRGQRFEHFRERLAEVDADGDGAWSLGELQAVRPELDVTQFNRLDTDGNGLLTADERPMRRHGRLGPRPRGL